MLIDSDHKTILSTASSNSYVILGGLCVGVRVLIVRGSAERHRAKWQATAWPLMDDS